ncbi:MAG: ABC transporter ATP-binding protein [Ilumatobacteraceae bacterium]
MSDARIVLDGVGWSYRIGDTTVTALADVDLTIAAGEFVVILGPSGSGKTTLLNLIGALDRPTSGTIRVDGTDITDASSRRRSTFRRHSVSFVFQSFNLFPGLTAAENIRFGADVSRRPDAARRTAAAADDVGLTDRIDHFPNQLSGGEQQRVAIARAIATGNPILLADEPTGELDFRTGIQTLRVLEGLARSGMSVLVVTHTREISRSADRGVERSRGRGVADGAPVGGRAEIAQLQW